MLHELLDRHSESAGLTDYEAVDASFGGQFAALESRLAELERRLNVLPENT
jgi:hypothetical protein